MQGLRSVVEKKVNVHVVDNPLNTDIFMYDSDVDDPKFDPAAIRC